MDLSTEFQEWKAPPYKGWPRDDWTDEDNKLDHFVAIKIQELKDEEYWELDTCILQHLPLAEQIRAIGFFVNQKTSFSGLFDDTAKLIYLLWPKYGHIKYQDKPKAYPHNLLFEAIYSVKQELKRLSTRCLQCGRFGDNNCDHCTKKGRDLGTSYIDWHMFGVLPLYGELGKAAFLEKCKMRYSDGQDMMTFVIYQMNPFKEGDLIKSVFRHWNKHENISLGCSGTGCRWQIERILKKWKRIGYPIDQEMVGILEEENFHSALREIGIYDKT